MRYGNYLLEDLYIYPPLTKSERLDGRRTLNVELTLRTWEKLRDLAAASSQAGTSPISAGELAVAIIEQYVGDATS